MMASVKWTEQQSTAIWSGGGDVLLSAAAGSGKTAVLSQRAMELIIRDENPIDIERLLIVTFTRSAAAEMKERIYKKLLSAASTNPSNRYLQTQMSKLPYASISTIHSFCLDLVGQYFQRLGISPTVRVADDGEIAALEREVLEEIIASRYEAKDKLGFLELVEYLSSGSNDKKLIEGILQIYHFLRSLPFYENWCENRLRLYNCSSIEESIWGKVVIDYCLAVAEYGIRQAKEAIDYAVSDPILSSNYGVPLDDDKTLLVAVRDYLISAKAGVPGSFERAQSIIKGFKHQQLGRKKGADEQDKAYLKNMRERVKSSVSDLSEHLLICTGEQFLEDVLDLKDKMRELFGIALELDQRVWEKKKELSAVDFSDLEHLTLSLLLNTTEVYGQFVPTELVEALSGRYDEIMVDECQDINEVQDLIFRTISRGNLFMVGDVKQSIYSFRQARPELFVEKLKKSVSYDGSNFPAKILLSNNFRSRSSVTDGINKVFERLMTEEVGGVDYGEEEYLYPAAPFAEVKDSGWELHYLSNRERDEDCAKREYEAAYTVKRIQTLLEEDYQVSDGNGGTRRVEYSDIAVLLRSPKSAIAAYRSAFEKAGIDVIEDVGESFLETTEIKTIINTLKIIDNPLLDIELLGVMLSPIGGFTADEVAEIRSGAIKGRLYSALQKQKADCPKAKALLELCNSLRESAAVLSVAELVMKIYEESAVHLVFRAMEKGERRFRNLMLFAEYVDGWEKRGCNGLTSVLQFIDGIIERGDDLVAASGDFSEQGVTIMSIHKSKGLEFPVVILGECGKKFNKMDIQASVVLDNNLGFTAMRRDRKLKRQFKTLPLLAARIKATENLVSEELRVLYVALTRAREKLIIIASVKDGMDYINIKETVLQDNKVSPYEVLKQNTYIDMVTTALASDYDLSSMASSSKEGSLKIVVAGMGKIDLEGEIVHEDIYEARADDEFSSKVIENMAHQYRYPAATLAPTKLSVSELAGKEFEEVLFAARPRFTLGNSISAPEIGIAVHAFMQLCDLKLAAKDPTAELERLTNMGILTKRQSMAVDLNKIKTFFRSSLWRLTESSERYLREYRFISYLKDSQSGEFAVAEDGEKTVLQGISDLVLITGKEAILVDFKTDRVKNTDRLVELYEGQMKLYKEMLSDTLGVDVKRAVLYSFHLGKEVEIPL